MEVDPNQVSSDQLHWTGKPTHAQFSSHLCQAVTQGCQPAIPPGSSFEDDLQTSLSTESAVFQIKGVAPTAYPQKSNGFLVCHLHELGSLAEESIC